MAIQNFFTSRENSADASTFVGQQDRLWYNISTNAIYASDGSTPGGVPITLGEGVDIVANSISVNYVSSDDSTLIQFLSDVEFREGATVNNDLEVNGNIIFSGNISAAAVGKIGGITPGPGVNVSNAGLLTLSSANVPFSFGNFTANNNILTIVNNNEDMVLATQGSAEVQLVGNVGFYKTNGLPPNTANRFFEAREDGQIKISVPDPDEILEGGVEIVGTTSGNIQAPGIAGTLLHITGSEDYPARIYIDGNDNYVSLVARRWNGTVDSPTQVLAGEAVLRLNTTAATDAGVGNVAMAQMRVVALENQTTTAQGSEFQFLATAIGTDAANRVEVANINVANGIGATKFTTAGNISAGNLLTNSIVSSAGNIVIDGNLIPAANNYSLGSVTDPWEDAFFGPQSITIQDSTGNVDLSVVIENSAGNITIDSAGFEIRTLDTEIPVFRIEALTGRIFSNALTIIENDTNASNTTSGSLQTAGGAGIAQDLYVGGNITSGNLNTSGQIVATGNITGEYFIGNGSQLTGISSSTYTDADVVDLLANNFGSNTIVTTGNINVGNIVLDGDVSNVGAIIFDTSYTESGSEPVGSLHWSDADKTLELHHPGNVVQQIGQESYAFVINNTGNTISDGRAVYFDGADAGRVEIQEMIANGSISTERILGITTQSIADGDEGRVTVLGKVRGLNTSSFSVGDFLYVDPGTAGALTNTRPTAPDNVITMGIVTVDDASNGEIFVRPDYEKQKNYGKFSRTTDQAVGNADTAIATVFNSSSDRQNINLDGSDASKIVFSEAGLYSITVNAQLLSTNSSDKDVRVWLAKDGTNLTGSLRLVTIANNNEYNQIVLSHNVSMTANSFIQVKYASTSTNMSLKAAPSTAYAPASNSVDVIITQAAL